jgi:hypothetical protein
MTILGTSIFFILIDFCSPPKRPRVTSCRYLFRTMKVLLKKIKKKPVYENPRPPNNGGSCPSCSVDNTTPMIMGTLTDNGNSPSARAGERNEYLKGIKDDLTRTGLVLLPVHVLRGCIGRARFPPDHGGFNRSRFP